jgi:hypothetical protein
MKVRFIILTTIVLLMVVLAGCGSTDSLSGRAGMLYFYSDT